MFIHYFKLVWARRKTSLLVIITLFISYVIMSFFSTLAYKEVIYIFFPLEFDYKHVYHYRIFEESIGDKSEAKLAWRQIDRQLKQIPQIESFSRTYYLVPLAGGNYWSGVKIDEEGEEVSTRIYRADDTFAELVKLSILNGRWFNESDNASRYHSAVINKELSEELFGNNNPLGETIILNDRTYQIVGLIKDYRATPDNRVAPEMFTRNHMDNARDSVATELLIRIRGDIEDKEAFHKEVESIVKGTAVSNSWKMGGPVLLEDLYNGAIKQFIFILVLVLAVALILLSNVAIGIFGVFWNNVLRRFSELGIRRAMGSSRIQIIKQILGEAFAISTLAIIPGFLVFWQMALMGFADMRLEYAWVPMIFAACFIYTFVLVCALYPAILAGRVQPADALREE